MTTDYTTSIKDLLEDNWTAANMTRTFTPVFDVDWSIKTWRDERRVSLRELASNHIIEDASNAVHRVEGRYQVDVWARDRTDALDMRTEVDRIINANNLNPFTGIKFIVQSMWQDLSTFEQYALYRYTCEVKTIAYVNA